MNGVIGSRSAAMSSRMRSSRIMKFVAEVSSSMSSVREPLSTASTRFAACDVDPDALLVENSAVSAPEGSPEMNGEISTPATDRPSSARIEAASLRVMTHCRPSPPRWLYTPRSSARSTVDLP